MTNIVQCPNCEIENNFYNLNCTKCGSLIRERVVNIDLWHTIGKIIDTPSKAFRNIIFAENKNYTFFLTIFFALKLTFNSFYFQSLIGKSIDFQNFLGINHQSQTGAENEKEFCNQYSRFGDKHRPTVWNYPGKNF